MARTDFSDVDLALLALRTEFPRAACGGAVQCPPVILVSQLYASVSNRTTVRLLLFRAVLIFFSRLFCVASVLLFFVCRWTHTLRNCAAVANCACFG